MGQERRVKKRVIKRQLHLFVHRDPCFGYKVIVTNKTESAGSIILIHNGRDSQESVFGDAKTDAGADAIPCKRIVGSQIFTFCTMMDYKLFREIQMLSTPPAPKSLPKDPAAWAFDRLDTLRHRIIQRADRLARPKGEYPRTMSANQAVREDLLHFLECSKGGCIAK